MTANKRIFGVYPRCGKSRSGHFCPKCRTELVRIGETLFYCPNCDLKVGALLR